MKILSRDRWLIGLVVLTCVRIWVGDFISVPQAGAQVPDSGLQRKQLLDEAQRTNALLTEMLDIFKNRSIRVLPAATDGAAAKPSTGAKRG